MQQISVIVVNWNTADLLADCLASLRAHLPDDSGREVIVVDNGSTDDSVAVVRERFPEAQLIVNERNEGYQRANNRGIRAATGEYLLLINADALLQHGSVEPLLGRMLSDDRAAVVGPRLVYGDGTFQRWTAGSAPDIASIAAFFLYGERLSSSVARRSLYLAARCRRRVPARLGVERLHAGTALGARRDRAAR